LNFQGPISLIEVTTLCDVGMVGGPVFGTSKIACEVMCMVLEFVVHICTKYCCLGHMILCCIC
jgi:hypothetical protein